MRKIDEFRMEMEEPKKIYTEELKRFIKKYDFLGEPILIEDPDIDTVDYIYYLNKLNGTPEDVLDSALNEIYAHMVNFSISNGIDEFSENAYVFYASARIPNRLEQFKLEMEGPKRIYTEELKRFVKKYDFLGEMTLVEEQDIETLDYQHFQKFMSIWVNFQGNPKLMNTAEMQSSCLGDIMDIRKYPQYQLYLFTMQMLMLKGQLIPKHCDEWCANASIINRAYYSSFLYCQLWLRDVKKFKVKSPWNFKNKKKVISEHKQVRNALYNFGEKNVKSDLTRLAHLRKKADYEPFKDISPEEVGEAIEHMENIFNRLKFE